MQLMVTLHQYNDDSTILIFFCKISTKQINVPTIHKQFLHIYSTQEALIVRTTHKKIRLWVNQKHSN